MAPSLPSDPGSVSQFARFPEEVRSSLLRTVLNLDPASGTDLPDTEFDLDTWFNLWATSNAMRRALKFALPDRSYHLQGKDSTTAIHVNRKSTLTDGGQITVFVPVSCRCTMNPNAASALSCLDHQYPLVTGHPGKDQVFIDYTVPEPSLELAGDIHLMIHPFSRCRLQYQATHSLHRDHQGVPKFYKCRSSITAGKTGNEGDRGTTNVQDEMVTFGTLQPKADSETTLQIGLAIHDALQKGKGPGNNKMVTLVNPTQKGEGDTQMSDQWLETAKGLMMAFWQASTLISGDESVSYEQAERSISKCLQDRVRTQSEKEFADSALGRPIKSYINRNNSVVLAKLKAKAAREGQERGNGMPERL